MTNEIIKYYILIEGYGFKIKHEDSVERIGFFTTFYLPHDFEYKIDIQYAIVRNLEDRINKNEIFLMKTSFSYIFIKEISIVEINSAKNMIVDGFSMFPMSIMQVVKSFFIYYSRLI